MEQDLGSIPKGLDGDDEISGHNGNDRLYGHDGDDQLNGNAGENLIYGHDGNDVINGGIGNDRIWGGNGDDYLGGNEGDDDLYGQNDDDTLRGGDGDDYLHGGADDDALYGDAGRDELFGGSSNDILFGGTDIVEDTLWGNAGTDTFNFVDGIDDLRDRTSSETTSAAAAESVSELASLDQEVGGGVFSRVALDDFAANGAEVQVGGLQVVTLGERRYVFEPSGTEFKMLGDFSTSRPVGFASEIASMHGSVAASSSEFGNDLTLSLVAPDALAESQTEDLASFDEVVVARGAGSTAVVGGVESLASGASQVTTFSATNFVSNLAASAITNVISAKFDISGGGGDALGGFGALQSDDSIDIAFAIVQVVGDSIKKQGDANPPESPYLRNTAIKQAPVGGHPDRPTKPAAAQGVGATYTPPSVFEKTFGQNSVTWTVDAKGRPVKAEAVLKVDYTGVARPNKETNDTTAVSELGPRDAAGKKLDHGGHLIAYRFLSSDANNTINNRTGTINMVSQNGSTNLSDMKKIENDIARFLIEAANRNRGVTVMMTVSVAGYDADANRPDRPTAANAFVVSYQIVDDTTNKVLLDRTGGKTYTFDNDLSTAGDSPQIEYTSAVQVTQRFDAVLN